MKNLYFELKKKILQDLVQKSLELELNNIDDPTGSARRRRR